MQITEQKCIKEYFVCVELIPMHMIKSTQYLKRVLNGLIETTA